MTTPEPDRDGPSLRQILWVAFLAAVLISLAVNAVTGSGDDTPTRRATPRPGAPEVYRQIATETNCRSLQDTFDRNMDDWDRRFDRDPYDPLLAVVEGYADAALERLQTIGCGR